MIKYIMHNEHKEDHKDKTPRIVYMLKDRKCFHIKEKCKHIKNKRADVITLCDECLNRAV